MKLLFVCVENSCRSQMAEAFARMYADQGVEAYSAGSRPSGVVNPRAIAVMAELGVDMGDHRSQAVSEVEGHGPFDAVVTMGCGDACPWVPTRLNLDWDLPDPKHMPPKEFRDVRDDIGRRVRRLIQDEGSGAATSPSPAAGEARAAPHATRPPGRDR
jgi:protein-tyrosine-phosphatase